MKYLLFLFGFVLIFSSCDKKQESCSKPLKEKQFDMYEMSEMSLLMEQMYVDNERLKQSILKGNAIGKFPNHFLKIHTSEMTNGQENDAFFKQQATKFIQSQELIYQDSKNTKQHFNASVNACIKCHEVKCIGPIIKIKKLYIK